ncbi:MAG TPA: type IV toxin-antitoxin system AbiEi family antitoxin domain-containing protein [Solirubrobacteraceae bacterium]|nr:type IV toxin-antitoxin system AbiEi family antitoxin domain-containing protein [Solirubrobacteraceae bacterium]
MSHGVALWKRTVALAQRQHGCVTWAQLIALGLPASTLAGWITRGRLFVVHTGVYAVGRPLATPLEYAAAAVLACGRLAALSHHSGLALLGLSRRWPHTMQVTVSTQRRRPGIVVHRSRSLADRDVCTHLGVRVTSPARTVLDCAPDLDDVTLGRLLADGRRSGLLSVAQLDDVLLRCVNHPGRPRLLALRDDTQAPTRSRFEDLLIPFCERYGLPIPQLNVWIAGRERDAFFPAERLILELDGWHYHQDRALFESDRDDDAEALALDLATYRLTWRRLIGSPDREAERLHRALAARRRRLGA